MPEFLYQQKLYYTPVEFVMDRIGGTWKMPILWRLQAGILRYGELKKSMPKITHKMLTLSLRELETDGFINRKVFAVVPPKVEYSLTPRGKRAITIISMLREYGFELMDEFGLSTKESHRSNSGPQKHGQERQKEASISEIPTALPSKKKKISGQSTSSKITPNGKTKMPKVPIVKEKKRNNPKQKYNRS